MNKIILDVKFYNNLLRPFKTNISLCKVGPECIKMVSLVLNQITIGSSNYEYISLTYNPFLGHKIKKYNLF